MKNLKFIFVPLFALALVSCGSSNEDSSDSSESSEETPTIHVSDLNPINEPYIAKQYYLNHIGDIYNTWRTYQGYGQTIAVVDVGFKYDHPDFKYEDGKSKVSELSAYIHTSGTEVTTDVGIENTRLTSDAPRNEYNNDHGTFCAGIAAAGINKKGVIGIAPLAELMLLRTDGHPLSICEAFKYAADKGARVVSVSIGSYKDYGGDLARWSECGFNLETGFNDAVKYCKDKGTVIISAGGNGGLDGDHSNTESTYPGDAKGVIGVGGLKANTSNEIWEGSSYNKANIKTFCEVFAPSDGMYGCCDYTSNKYDGGLNNDGSQKWIGTSFAAPIVAGIAALYFEKNPSNSVDDFYNDLTSKARSFSPTSSTAYGRVDVGNLLGTRLTEKVTAKIKNTGPIYMYQWDSTSNKKMSWPGTQLGTSGTKTYEVELDASKYDSVLFHTGGNDDTRMQTIDLSISSFSFNNVYDADTVTYCIPDKVVIGTFNKTT